MIGYLPTTLTVDGVDCPINTDYRAVLTIFEALESKELSPLNKAVTMLEILYDFNIPSNLEEAQKQAHWFLDVGGRAKKDTGLTPKTMDYAQDEQLLFSAVNAVVGRDIREDKHMHWWTFYGLCQAINPDSLMAHIVSYRHKRGTGEKLKKWEQKFYRENRHLIDFESGSGFDGDYAEMVRALRGG